MATSNQLAPGMTISINGKFYRVESSVKVTVPKGTPFIKVTLRDLSANETIERNFKIGQSIKDVSLADRRLEFLYPEGTDYLFIDIDNLEQVLVPAHIVTSKVNYLKEGIEVKASFYGDNIFAIELPQFLELMIVKIEREEQSENGASVSKLAVLETGAKIEVPPFVETGDIIKVDTKTEEYVQRV